MAARSFADVMKDSPTVGSVHVSSAGGSFNRKPRRKWSTQKFWAEIAKISTHRQLRMIDDENAHSPFPHDPNALANLRPDQVPRFLGAITNPESLEQRSVSLADLNGVQDRVNAGKVEAIAASDNKSARKPVVVRTNGRNYIADGHHRLAAEWLNGAKTADVAYKDLTPVDQAVKGFSPDQPRGPDGKFIPKDGAESDTARVSVPRTGQELLVRNMKHVAFAVAGVAAASIAVALAPEASVAGAVISTAAGMIDHAATGMLIEAAASSFEHILNSNGISTRGVRSAFNAMVDAYDEAIGKADAFASLPADVLQEARDAARQTCIEATQKLLAMLHLHGADGGKLAQIEPIINEAKSRFLDTLASLGGKITKSGGFNFTVAKADADKPMMFGWASVVEKDGQIIIDKQGDMIAPETLEKAAYDYMLHAREHGNMHEDIGTGRCIESMMFTAEKQAALGIDLGKVGWWVGYKVEAPEVWAAVKRGELPEFSIGGQAQREEIA